MHHLCTSEVFQVFSGAVNQLLTELFPQSVSLPFRRITMVDIALHELKHVVVGPTKEGNTACSDFLIDSG